MVPCSHPLARHCDFIFFFLPLLASQRCTASSLCRPRRNPLTLTSPHHWVSFSTFGQLRCSLQCSPPTPPPPTRQALLPLLSRLFDLVAYVKAHARRRRSQAFPLPTSPHLLARRFLDFCAKVNGRRRSLGGSGHCTWEHSPQRRELLVLWSPEPTRGCWVENVTRSDIIQTQGVADIVIRPVITNPEGSLGSSATTP
jgi:hypothetical protein